MTDLADASSTTLDTTLPAESSGGGMPPTIEEPAKPESVHDTVAAAVKESGKPKEEAPAEKADAPKPDAEKGAKAEEKPDTKAGAKDAEGDKKPAERGADGKFAAKAAAKDGEAEAESKALKSEAESPPKADDKQEQGGHFAPPSKFLPDAKEKWTNVPRSVQRDVDNLVREHEAEATKYREAAERYEPIRQYDEHVRQNGRAGIHETLAEVAQTEEMLKRNPLAGLNHILLRAGPRKADGSPVTLFDVAQTIVQMGQEKYQQAVAHRPAQPQNDNGEIAQLKAQLAQVQQQQLASTVLEPFKRDHPRYAELEGDIAFFLKSGKIPTSLSPHDRLEAAYDMAARINPASHVEEAAEPQADPDPGRRADEDLSGSKSIKSAPGAVSADMEPERGGSIRDLLTQEVRRVGRSR